MHVVTIALTPLLPPSRVIIQETVPLFGAEVAHRAVELLKVFNSQVWGGRWGGQG